MASAPRTAPSDRVPLRQKLGYATGSLIDMWGHWLYPTLTYQVFNLHLGIAPSIISTAQMIKILWDAVSDAVFGWASDNARTRYGRRRPFILVGGTLAGLCLPLLFAVKPGWADWQYFAFMVGSTVLYGPMVAAFNMPWLSLGAEMTPDYHERTSVMAIRNAVQKAPEVAMFFALQFTTLPWFTRPDGSQDILRGAQTYCQVLGVLMVLAAWTVFTSVRERYYTHVVASHQAKVSILDTLYRTLSCRPFRLLLMIVLAYGIGTGMVAALGYYTTVYFVCGGNLALATKWNTIMGVAGMVLGLSGIAFFKSLAARFDKRAALVAVFALGILAFGGSWWFYDPQRPYLQLLACGFVAFTGAGFWTLYHSVLADVMDYDELDSGKRREGSISACQSWISKLGLALGAGASGWMLELTGFDAKLPTQSTETIQLIRLLLAAVPVAGLAIALAVTLRFPLTAQRMADVRRTLEARRGAI